MPTFHSSDNRSTIRWNWLNEQQQRIAPESLKWALWPDEANDQLRTMLLENATISAIGGQGPEDIRGYYECVLEALAILEESFPSIVFDLPAFSFVPEDGELH